MASLAGTKALALDSLAKGVNSQTGMALTDRQRKSLELQAAQLSGKTSREKAQAEIKQTRADNLAKSTTINRFQPTDEANQQAQVKFNEQYKLPEDTGLASGVTQTLRTKSLAPATPTPTPVNPMIPVSAQGANTPVKVATQTINPNTPTSQFVLPETNNAIMPANQENAYGIQQAPQVSIEEYMQMTPEQQLDYQSRAFRQQGQQQMGVLGGAYDMQTNALAEKQRALEEQLKEEQAALEAENAEKEASFKEAQQAAVEQATRQIQAAAGERTTQLGNTMAFQGFGRSTRAMELQDTIRQDTQAQIADINRQAAVAVDEFKASLLDKTNEKLDKLQAKIDNYGDAKDQIEFEKVKAQGDLMIDLFKQDPMNPQNMLETAQKLQTMKLDQRKMDLEEQKAVRDDAQKNFQYMINTFGTGYLGAMSNEELINLSSNLGVSPNALANLPKTVDEIKQEWDMAKYSMDQEFEINKMTWQAQQDLEKLGVSFGYDMQKMYLGEQFKSEEEARKYGNLGYGTFVGQASGADGSSLYFDAPTTINGKQVIASNPKIVNAYPNGYKKTTGLGSLSGQCLAELQQIVDCPKLGNSLQEKLNSLGKLVKQGAAFYKGQGQPQVGYTVISNDSKKYGHGWVINSIKPDGTLVASEFNYAAPLTFSNTREVRPDDPSIYGFIKTKPKAGYQVAKGVEALAKDVADTNLLTRTGATVLGSTATGSALGQIGSQVMKHFGADKALINQAMQGEQAFEAGAEDEQGLALTPDRQAIRSGAMTLDADTVSKLRQYNPQAYNQYMSDLTYSKSKGGEVDFTQTNQLYNRYDSTSKEIRTLDQGFAITKSFDVNTKNPYDDQALIFSFMKVLDPGSVVREGEFRTAQNNASYLQSISANWQNAASGTGMLLPEQRQKVLDAMNSLYDQKMKQYGNLIQGYADTGAKLGITDPSLFLDYTPNFFNQYNQTGQTGGGYTMPEYQGNTNIDSNRL